jgi:hypothetical protein
MSPALHAEVRCFPADQLSLRPVIRAVHVRAGTAMLLGEEKCIWATRLK